MAWIAGDAEWLKSVTACSMGAAAGSAIFIAFKRAENVNPWVPEDSEVRAADALD